ncbi:hypothetical protein A3D04_01130 [Candidatus Curtissbacteria bacterium RIFCSPHIGHO2_02_FULL_40_16b]|uniref:Transcriptional regulator MraZ n=1 Tax=Candidatus Curtissbacteria bacterium RIFCSPHIGHO2_02_FULL_40_16b TaxID=1797714 RepID=A0A1F5G9Q4_9BACT|nr:MAG: hypothetical protein A3D04_01130 [Candidatus Curtissbacteria bacterium RIFCSPHIGHO2_02_FULL_40_16b]
MFLGSYIPSFNLNSRRLALPKKIRDYLATSEIILSIGFEKCLFGFDTKNWQAESKKQLVLPITQRRSRDLRRIFFASATPIKLDDQGRFVIPSDLLEYAKIKRPIIIGAGDHFEIWERRTWQEERLRLDKEIR